MIFPKRLRQTTILAGTVLALSMAGCATPVAGNAAQVEASSAQTSDELLSGWSDKAMATGRSRFMFGDWGGPEIPVWTYVPPSADRATAPVMFLLHGAKRDPRRYLEEWVDEADEGGFIVIAPEFSRADFRGSRSYNRGGLFAEKGAPISDEESWTFSAIEPLFDTAIGELGGSQTEYTIYGHSAGSQFVHRFLFLKPDARAKRFLPANAGWYTFPSFEVDYPYGLDGVPVTEESLRSALAKDVVLLLGDRDIDTEHSSLNRSELAMQQGPHRFARGKAFYEAARDLAKERSWEFNWSVRVIPGVSHSNGGIAAGAFDLVE